MIPIGEQYAEHMLLAYTGGVTRQDNEQRIDFLARVRNKALGPLHWHQNHSDNGSNHNNHGQSSSSSSHTYLHSNIKSSSSSSSDGGVNATTTNDDGDHVVFKADKVVFLNDVYFCAQHIHRLLAHEEANLACGLDHYQVSTAKHIPRALRKGIWGLQVCHCMLYFALILSNCQLVLSVQSRLLQARCARPSSAICSQPLLIPEASCRCHANNSTTS